MHVSSLAQASGRNTVVLDKFEPTPVLRLNGHKVWQKKDQRVVLLWNDFRREHLELQEPADSATTTLHREEARAEYARAVKRLRRAPARRSCPPWSIPGRLWLLLMWPTFLRKGKRRFDALGYKPPAGSQLLETRHAITSCLEATRLLSAVALLDGSSQNLVRWALSRVAWYTACVIFWKVASWTFSGGNVARITVVLLWFPTSTSEGGCSGFTPGTGSTLSTREHLIC